MDINRTVKYPKPYVYHPEQFPDLEEFNPSFTNWHISDRYLANKNRKDVDKVKFKYRKLYKVCNNYDYEEFASTSKIKDI